MQEKMNSVKKIELLILVSLGVIYVIKLTIECLYGVPSFDGAMNLQVPLQLIRNGKYMTTYNGGIIFDSVIQTRLPVLLPIYIIWKCFGVSSVSALMVNAIYIILLQFFTWKLLEIIGVNKETCFITSMVIVVMPNFDKFAMGIYGEIPTLALIMGSVYWLVKYEKCKLDGKRYLFFSLSGIFFSLAVLNKTVALIAIPSYIFMFIINLIKSRQKYIKNVVIWFISFLIPLLIEEIFHIIQINDFKAYIDACKSELLGVAYQAGVKKQYKDTPNIFEKFWTHVNIFCSDYHFKLGAIIFILLLLLILGILAYLFFIKKEQGMENILFLIMFSYFGWWTLITPTAKAWARRILPGAVLLVICILYLLYRFIEWKINKTIVWQILFVLFSIYFGVTIVDDCMNYDYKNKNNIMEVADKIKSINEDEEASFYGIGWWQAPVLSFYSGVDLYDLNKNEITENSYFVLDGYTKNLSDSFDKVCNKYDLELVIEVGSNSVYKILPIAYEEHTYQSAWKLDEIDMGKVCNNWDLSQDYEYAYGAYGYEESNMRRWVSDNFEIVLNTVQTESILLDTYVVNTQNMTSSVPRIYIYIDGEYIESKQLLDGINKIVIDTSKHQNEKCDLRIVTNSILKLEKDKRRLAFILKNISCEEE